MQKFFSVIFIILLAGIAFGYITQGASSTTITNVYTAIWDKMLSFADLLSAVGHIFIDVISTVVSWFSNIGLGGLKNVI